MAVSDAGCGGEAVFLMAVADAGCGSWRCIGSHGCPRLWLWVGGGISLGSHRCWLWGGRGRDSHATPRH